MTGFCNLSNNGRLRRNLSVPPNHKKRGGNPLAAEQFKKAQNALFINRVALDIIIFGQSVTFTNRPNAIKVYLDKSGGIQKNLPIFLIAHVSSVNVR